MARSSIQHESEMKILVPGGAGYIGALLVPQLLAEGHKVTVFDPMWFGDGHLPKSNGNIKIIKGDVRNQSQFKKACEGKDAVLYLASISNNAMSEINHKVFNEVNCGAFAFNVGAAKQVGVKRFIYASSVAGYAKDDVENTEDETLWPLTHYALSKAAAEEALKQAHDYDFTTVITRSASVGGYSPHQRFDTTLNMMVHDAMRKKLITVNGGEQIRSHVNIQDVCDFYKLLLKSHSSKVSAHIFNIVAQNQKVMETAEIVAKMTGAGIRTQARSDARSYRVSGAKARNLLDWEPKRKVEDSIRDLKIRFDSGHWKDSETNAIYQNIATGLV